MMLDPHYNGLGLVINFVDKKRSYKLVVSMTIKLCFHFLFFHTTFLIQLMQVLELLAPHHVMLNPQVFMILWKQIRNDIISCERTFEPLEVQESY